MEQYILENEIARKQTELTADELVAELNNVIRDIETINTQINNNQDYKSELLTKRTSIETILTQLGVDY